MCIPTGVCVSVFYAALSLQLSHGDSAVLGLSPGLPASHVSGHIMGTGSILPGPGWRGPLRKAGPAGQDCSCW